MGLDHVFALGLKVFEFEKIVKIVSLDTWKLIGLKLEFGQPTKKNLNAKIGTKGS
jgi:hypothetical protein